MKFTGAAERRASSSRVQSKVIRALSLRTASGGAASRSVSTGMPGNARVTVRLVEGELIKTGVRKSSAAEIEREDSGAINKEC